MSSTPTINGLHHVTAISGDARTVNFDDPSVDHLYYGDEVGTPGTALTFFPWAHLPRGRAGTGETSITSFAVPPGGLGFWRERLAAHGVEHGAPADRFGEPTLAFRDPDGMGAALVEPAEPDDRTPWTTPEVGPEHAIRGFHGVTLALTDRAATARLLTDIFGYEPAGREGDLHRYASPHAAHARYVDVLESPSGGRALQGAGSVHHIAFSVRDDAAQMAFRERLGAAGLHVTPQVDRDYFRSIYFRTPGGVLFEIATEEPGFTVDEPREELGRSLKLPRQHEHLRARLERELPPLRL